MGRASDRLVMVLMGGAAALAYLFHEILQDSVGRWIAAKLAAFGGLFAQVTERAVSLSLTTALAAVVVASLYRRIRNEFEDDLAERLRPKLSCSFDMGDGDCRQTTAMRTGSGRMTSFRLKVAADRIGSVEGCRGRLVSIRRGHEAVLDGERLVLPFIPANALDATAKRIDARVPELLEFLQISDRNTIEVPTVTRANAISVKTLFLQPGDYTFLIIVSSPESATTVQPVLHWTGDYRTAKVTLG